MAAYPNFTGANFAGCSLFSVNLNDTNWTNADLSGAAWVNVSAQQVVLNGANMANMSVKRSQLTAPNVGGGGGLNDANVAGVDFTNASSFGMGGYRVQGAGTATFPATKAVVQDDSYGTVIFGSGVQVPYISLQGLNLNGKDLGGGVNLRQANLTGTNLNGANLIGADLTGATLTGATFIDADLQSSTFDDSFNFTIPLDDTALRGAGFAYTQLNGANLSGMDLRGAGLAYGSLQGANLSGTNLRDTNLYNSQLQGANLSGANLTNAYLERANLTGADLSGTTRTEVVVTVDTVCKNGFFYGTNGNTSVDACFDRPA